MSHLGRAGLSLLVITMVLIAVAETAHAQAVAPNPYATVPGVWGQLAEGRTWGATSAVYPSPDGNTIWVGERCGENNCQGKDDIDPILLFDTSGKLLDSWGAGEILWPHGMHVDSEGNVWVTDAVGFGVEADHRGHTV